jgi:hypothetical protein
METPEREMKDYEKLVVTMAWKFKRTFKGIKELEDLIQDGWEVFIKLKEKEKKKPLTCQFGTALSIQIKQGWLDELKKSKAKKRELEVPYSQPKPEIERDIYYPSYDPTLKIENCVDISSEMRMVIRLIMDAPSELAELCETASLRRSIGIYVKNILGWKIQRVRKLDAELFLAMNQSKFVVTDK